MLCFCGDKVLLFTLLGPSIFIPLLLPIMNRLSFLCNRWEPVLKAQNAATEASRLSQFSRRSIQGPPASKPPGLVSKYLHCLSKHLLRQVCYVQKAKAQVRLSVLPHQAFPFPVFTAQVHYHLIPHALRSEMANDT